jgi:hypothetical protein
MAITLFVDTNVLQCRESKEAEAFAAIAAAKE